MLNPRILRGLIFLLWFVTAAAIAQAQTSRASSAALYLERGNQWLAKGEWDRAIADYDLAIDFEARSTIYGNRGIAKQQKGDLAGALNDYDRAIGLDPLYIEAYLNRGIALYGLRQCEAAIRDFSKAIEINPLDFRGWSDRGVARVDQGNF